MKKLATTVVLGLIVLAGSAGCRRFDVPGTWNPTGCTTQSWPRHDCPPPKPVCPGGGRPIGSLPGGGVDCVNGSTYGY